MSIRSGSVLPLLIAEYYLNGLPFTDYYLRVTDYIFYRLRASEYWLRVFENFTESFFRI